MSSVRLLMNRIIVYLLGVFILSFGIAISVQAGLGVSPVSVTPYVLSLSTDLSLGVWTIILYSFFILLQILILRKDFKWINLAQLLVSTIFGYFVNLSTSLLSGFKIPGYAGSLLMLALSIIVIAVGITLYVGAGLINMPAEALAITVAGKLNKDFGQVKIVLDSSLVVLAIILSLLLQGRLVAVREGTVISALLIGAVVKPVKKRIQPLLDRVFIVAQQEGLEEPADPEDAASPI